MKHVWQAVAAVLGTLLPLGFTAGDARAESQVERDLMNDPAFVEQMLGADWASVDRQIALREIDRKALDESEKYQRAVDAPAPLTGAQGRVIYEFGATTPRVICSLAHICDIEMQKGELIYDTKAGDDKRWDIVSAGSEATQHVVVKPKQPNLATNLVIYTNRRTYLIELVSAANEQDPITPFIGFHYPEDTKAQWMRLREQMTSRTPSRAAEQSSATPLSSDGAVDEYELRVRPGSLHFGYEIAKAGRWLSRRRTKWTPVRVYDDGQKTFIEMPKRVDEAPVLVVEEDGGNTVLNMRAKGRVLIVDRLFNRAAMLLGAGWWRQQKVIITRKEE